MKKFIPFLIAIIFCNTVFSQTQRATVASGNWNNTATWSGGVLPSSSEQPVISAGHTVTYNVSTGTYAGIVINGTLSMTNSGTHTLTSNNKNILVNGTLNMSVTSYSDNQVIIFSNVNENNYVGSGEVVLSTDIGLWVTDTGQLNLDGRVSGSDKTHFVHATGSITNGQSTIAIDQTPANWLANDSIIFVPTLTTAAGDDFIIGFDDRKLSSNVSTASVTVSTSTGKAHPKINSTWGAEILNITRPIRIEGTATGKAHIFIKSSKVQTIRDVAFRHLGPRKDINSDGVKELVQGRYGLHFHHCEEGSRGSIVENCVMRNVDNHCFVPHGSHGITFKKNMVYDCTESAFWWDLGHLTHDNVWDSNLVALPRFVSQSIALPFEEEAPTFAASCFELGPGDGNVATNNVAIGAYGDSRIGAGFDWEADNEGVWVFKNNLSHNCVGGLRVWQNTTKNHVLENFTVYNCVEGIFHGAYANSYRYLNGTMYDAPLIIEAASTHTSRVRFENYTMNAAGLDYCAIMESSPLDGALPMLFRNCTFSGYAVAGLDDQSNAIHSADVIQCTGTAVVDANAGSTEVIRIQPSAGQATKKTKAGTTNISNFAPTIWGDGTGLLGEYYSNTNLTGLLFTRVDSYVGFSEWENGVHHLITDNTYSVRWTGQFQPQFTEQYKFKLSTGGGIKLWINDTLRINRWTEHYPDTDSTGLIALTAGTKYNIKIEYFNDDAHTGVNLYWTSPGVNLFTQVIPAGEYIPQSQLWPDTPSPRSSIVQDVIPTQIPVEIKGFTVPTFVRDRILVRSPKDATYRLYDMNGRLLRTGRIMQGVNYIPAATIHTGIILLKVDNDKLFKLIKE